MKTEEFSKILLVDDDQDFLDVLQELLQIFGLSVISARSADEARKIATLNQLDALLIDYHLGTDDGLSLAFELIDSISTPVRVAILSGEEFNLNSRMDLSRRGIDTIKKNSGVEKIVEFCRKL